MDISHLCNESITIYRQSSVSSAGDPTYTTATALANIRRDNRIEGIAGGESKREAIELYTKTEILAGDRITLPGKSGQAESLPVVSTQPSVLPDGVTQFWRVML